MGFVNTLGNNGDSNRTQILEVLLQKVKECGNESEKESVIIEIVNLALRSRTLCRQYKGQPLEGIYREIYDRVYSFLMDEIYQKCEKSDLIASITDEWLDGIQLQAFRTILDDTRLKQLAINAQKQSPNSALRSYALTELIKAIQISNKLSHPHRGLFANDFYPLIYEEAVVKTMTYICTNIDRYDPQRGQGKFMNWVNFKLDKNILICRRQFDLSYKYEAVSLDKIKTIPSPSEPIPMGDLLYQYIKEDPNGVFQKTYIADNPQANFKTVALRRLSGKTWKEIAREFQIQVPVLSAFYQRNCQKFKTLLQEVLEN